MVRSENDDEVIEIIQEHARDTHDMQMSESDVRDGWQQA